MTHEYRYRLSALILMKQLAVVPPQRTAELGGRGLVGLALDETENDCALLFFGQTSDLLVNDQLPLVVGRSIFSTPLAEYRGLTQSADRVAVLSRTKKLYGPAPPMIGAIPLRRLDLTVAQEYSEREQNRSNSLL